MPKVKLNGEWIDFGVSSVNHVWPDDKGNVDISGAFPKVYSFDFEPASAVNGDIWINKNKCLKFIAEEANSTLQVSVVGSVNGRLQYSLNDGLTWHDFGDTVVTLANPNDYVLVKGNGGAISNGPNSYTKFVMTGQMSVIGKISNLAPMGDYCYYKLFDGCTSLTEAPELPATELAENCYERMFHDCTSLTEAPGLPATTLANSCYEYMFSGCTSLTEAPELPATTLADSCYRYMFQNCTSLTEASELPATTLVDSCYRYMFSGCTSLIKSPIIRATSFVGSYCMNSMFQGCSYLYTITVCFTSWPAKAVTSNWVKNVPTTGAFYCPSTLPDERDTKTYGKIPGNWTKMDLTAS